MNTDTERAAIDRVTHDSRPDPRRSPPRWWREWCGKGTDASPATPTREFAPILVEDAALDALRVMPTAADRLRR